MVDKCCDISYHKEEIKITLWMRVSSAHNMQVDTISCVEKLCSNKFAVHVIISATAGNVIQSLKGILTDFI